MFGKNILNLECELGLLDTQWNALLASDSLDLDKMRELTNKIDDVYDELLDEYQAHLDDYICWISNSDDEDEINELKISIDTTVERMAEICAIMFQ